MEYAAFPRTRLRRGRRFAWTRALLTEQALRVEDLIWPVFVHDGDEARIPVPSMPGVHRYSMNALVEAVREAAALGIPAVALFPAVDPRRKDEAASEALNPDNLACRTLRLLKREVPDIGLIGDVALDPYTSHGHDGLLRHGEVDNDGTVARLCQQAILLAEAGCDIVAPSDMMDGRIGAIRDALDAAGHGMVAILSYAVKYASAFYGPFRDAVGSRSALGQADKTTYQMNPANGVEAIREAALDAAEGADILMVKPGIFYLDIIRRLTECLTLPVFAYQVSGEYAMLKAAAANGWLDETAAMQESLLALKRAGARAILTYAAKDMARLLREKATKFPLESQPESTV